MRSISSAAAAVLLLCGSAARADDTSPPVISHTPVSRGERGRQTPLFARIADESKIFPQIFFRFGPGSAYEKPIDMKPVKGQKSDPDRPFRVDFGPLQTAQDQPTLPLPAVPRSSAGSRGGGRLWTWLVGGTGLGLLTGGLVANPLGARATALDVAGGTLIAAGIALYFIEAPKDSPGSSGDRRAGVRLGATPLPGGGALALAGRF